ncbi:hypothetical protein F4678DRAFT_442348 [Xylaria arbuscula]|nr:hypothetical protein F4678DRAFT_442348 [Xylaria arbuscula]
MAARFARALAFLRSLRLNFFANLVGISLTCGCSGAPPFSSFDSSSSLRCICGSGGALLSGIFQLSLAMRGALKCDLGSVYVFMRRYFYP